MYLKRNNEFEILGQYLSDYGKQFYLREMSRLVKLPIKTAQNALNALENKNILKSKFMGKNKYFSLNIDNIETKMYLLQAEIHKTLLFFKRYPQFKSFAKGLPDRTIIVFGSFAKLIAEKNSDLGLLVIAEAGKKLPVHLLPYKIHEIRMPEKSFIEAIKKQEALIKEIEENHIILNNHSFYMNKMWEQYGK